MIVVVFEQALLRSPDPQHWLDGMRVCGYVLLDVCLRFCSENVHAREGLACRKRVAPASSPASH